MTGTAASSTAPENQKKRRSALVWVVLVVVILGVAALGGVLASVGQYAQRGTLDPDSAGPRGTAALTEILRAQGVEVTVARSVDEATALLGQGTATLVITDDEYLSDEIVDELAGAAARTVVQPTGRLLDLLFDGSSVAGYGDGAPVAANCRVRETELAGAVAVGTLMTPGGSIEGCYPDGTGAFGLLSDGDRFAVDVLALFSNENLATDGNAALGVSLLGANDRVVWIVPTITDTDIAADATLGSVTPDWVTPAIVMLAAAAIAAAVWRGRRFGPLVAENLPVSVRASETTAGRARLYARSGEPVHAADQLRIGALQRIGRMLGLGAASSATDIADGAAARVGADHAAVRALLIDDVPRTDSDLVQLAGRIRHLETTVRAAVRGRNDR